MNAPAFDGGFPTEANKTLGAEGTVRLSGPDLDEIKTLLVDRIEDLAETLLGPPNPDTRRRNEWRWGNKGSTALHVRGAKKGLFYSHETGTGGSAIDLIIHTRSCTIGDAIVWARDFLGISCGFGTYRQHQSAEDDAGRERQRAAKQAETEAIQAADQEQRIAAARDIWNASTPIDGTAAEQYLVETRKIPRPADGWPSDVLRFHAGDCMLVLAATTDTGDVQAVQRIYLTPDAQNVRRRDNSKVKLSLGVLRAAVVRLPGNSAGPLLLAEGPETGLSAWVATGHETWVTLGAVRSAALPSGRQVAVCRDDDPPGSAADVALHRALVAWRAGGVAVAVASPWPERRGDKSDMNDAIQIGGAEAVRTQIDAALSGAETHGEPLDEQAVKKAAIDAAVARLKLLEKPAYLAVRVDEAKALGVPVAALDQLWREGRKADEPKDEAAPPKGAEEIPADPETLTAEIVRLAELDDVDYARERRPAAKRLAVPVGLLDKKVKEVRAAKPASTDDRAAAIKRLADLPKLEYDAVRKAEAAAIGVNVSVLDEEVAAEKARRCRQAEEESRGEPPPGPGEIRWPRGFEMKFAGLCGRPAPDADPIWLAAPFEVLGHTRDRAGEDWGSWLRWSDRDGVPHTYSMPSTLLVTQPGQLEAELLRRGLRINVDGLARSMLRSALAGVKTGDRVRLASRTGWQDIAVGHAFLLPDGTLLGKSTEPVVLQYPPANAAQRCAEAGTLARWKSSVAAPAAGNPLATFYISANLSAPLLKLTGEQGGGAHAFGASKVGKTMALKCGVSVWGLPQKNHALRDWKSTSNALEATAAESHDMPVSLDEIQQAAPTDLCSSIYMLADGGGKSRLKSDASAAAVREWNTVVLSTGEVDIPTLVTGTGRPMPAGAEVRMPSIPVGSIERIWPNLHGHNDFGKFSAALHRALDQQHGTAGRTFVTRLAAEWTKDVAGLTEFLDAERAKFAETLPADANQQVRDVARRFSLFAAAGELATRWGILPWQPGDATRAVLAMFNAWLARRPARTGAAETAAQLERVRTVLVLHGSSRFTRLKPAVGRAAELEEEHPERPVQNRIGWRKSDDGRDEFFIPPETWKSEICAPEGLDAVETARALKKAGFLRHEPKRLSVNERLPGHRDPVRVYAVSAAILEDQKEAEGPEKRQNSAPNEASPVPDEEGVL